MDGLRQATSDSILLQNTHPDKQVLPLFSSFFYRMPVKKLCFMKFSVLTTLPLDPS
jgi:hypothetical protein